MKKYLFPLAYTCFILLVLVHILSAFGIDLREYLPFVEVIPYGVFLVGFPAFQFERKHKKEFEEDPLDYFNTLKFTKILYKNVPGWLQAVGVSIGVYFILSFFIFIMYVPTNIGTPKIIDGQYTLQYKGHIKKTITEDEYHYYRGIELWGTTGIWIALYAATLSPLYKLRQEELNKNI